MFTASLWRCAEECKLLDRERRDTKRRIQQARFPMVKSLDTFHIVPMARVEDG